MNRSVQIILLIIITLAIILGASIYIATDNTKPTVIPQPTPTATTEATNSVPPEFTSGNSRFSQGACTTDEDCVIGGCSAEVCGNEEAISTCEFSRYFPNDEKFDCGCVNNVCGWSN